MIRCYQRQMSWSTSVLLPFADLFAAVQLCLTNTLLYNLVCHNATSARTLSAFVSLLWIKRINQQHKKAAFLRGVVCSLRREERRELNLFMKRQNLKSSQRVFKAVPPVSPILLPYHCTGINFMDHKFRTYSGLML